MDAGTPEWRATERFALMYSDTVAALAAADPVGLIDAGAPDDEYDIEAAQVVRLVLSEAQSRDDVLRIAGDVLAHYFGHRHDDRLGGFADSVWRRYEELRNDT